MLKRPPSLFEGTGLRGALQNSMFRTNPNRPRPKPRVRTLLGMIVGIGVVGFGAQALQNGRVGVTTASVAVTSENIAVSDDPSFVPSLDSSLAEAVVQTGTAEIVSCGVGNDDLLEIEISAITAEGAEYEFSQVLVTFSGTVGDETRSGKHVLVVGGTNSQAAEAFIGAVPGEIAGFAGECEVVSVIGYHTIPES